MSRTQALQVLNRSVLRSITIHRNLNFELLALPGRNLSSSAGDGKALSDDDECTV